MTNVEMLALENFSRKLIELVCGIDALCVYMVETNKA